MLINAHGDHELSLWSAADIVGADLYFRGGDTYLVTVYVGGYKVGETRKHRSSREWVEWIRSLNW